MNLRIANIDKKPRWNKQYLKENLDFKKVKRIYIRGPEDFNF